MSQQPRLTAMLCLGVGFTLITWLGDVGKGGKNACVWWRRAPGQLDHQFEFLLVARAEISAPQKIEGNKRLGLSKQPLRVFLFPPFPYFSCPSSSVQASARL